MENKKVAATLADSQHTTNITTFAEKQHMATSKNLPDLTEEPVRPYVFEVSEEDAQNYLALIYETAINPEKPEPEPEVLFSLDGTPILWRTGKSFVCAVAKARKTTTLTFFTSILCGRDETANGFKAAQNCKVLYIDTEQSRYDSQRILNRVAELCDRTAAELTASKHLTVLPLNRFTPKEIREIMEVAIRELKPDVVILDNWTDCVESIMDDAVCTMFSRQLRKIAEVYDIAIFSVIHANESAQSDNKPNFRGWGAEEARKSDLTMFLKNMEEFSEASFGRCRGKKPNNFNISIDDNGLPYAYRDTQEAAKPQANVDKYAPILAKVPKHGASFSEMAKLIRDNAKVVNSDATARDWVGKMEKAGAIAKVMGKNRNDTRYYRPEDKPAINEEKLPF